MKFIFLLSVIALVSSVIILSEQNSFGHKDGCHRWHSCPSDSGSYACGDTGHCSECPDNNYCKAGQPYTQESYYQSKPSYSEPVKSELTKKTTLTEKPTPLKSKINTTKPKIIVYDNCKSLIRIDLKYIETKCYKESPYGTTFASVDKKFKFKLPTKLEQGFPNSRALFNQVSKVYQYDVNEFEIGLFDQVGEKKYQTKLWELP